MYHQAVLCTLVHASLFGFSIPVLKQCIISLFPVCFACAFTRCILEFYYHFVPVPFYTLFHHKPQVFIRVWHNWFWRVKAKYKKKVSHVGMHAKHSHYDPKVCFNL